MRADKLTRRVLASALAVAAAAGAAGCSEEPPSETTGKPTDRAAKRATSDRNSGSGDLRRTGFAVDPVISIIKCRAGDRKCYETGYAIFARLTRDIPRRASGQIAARFEVSGLRDTALALSNGDPIGRLSKPRFCFQQTVGTKQPRAFDLPTDVGAPIRVTLTALDSDGDVTGKLSTIVRLSPPEPPREQNDYSPPEQQDAIGC